MRKEEDSTVAGVRIRMGRLGPHTWLDGRSHPAAAVDRCFMISKAKPETELNLRFEGTVWEMGSMEVSFFFRSIWK